MKKKILCIFTIILTILAGCAKEEKSNIEVSDDEVGIETMEGMNYLVAGNDYGFYFSVVNYVTLIVNLHVSLTELISVFSSENGFLIIHPVKS